MDPEETLYADNPSFSNFNSNHQFSHLNRPGPARESNKMQDFDPTAMLNNLAFLETKIHDLQDLVHVIVSRKSQNHGQDEIFIQQQQLITADLTSIIVQLISTAGSLLWIRAGLQGRGPKSGRRAETRSKESKAVYLTIQLYYLVWLFSCLLFNILGFGVFKL
ncbi:sensitive to proton rhizotoxicity [Castilleja foliolosa]|uniref:Sensitive to proton rhizotoxicity n=1 Tax=Castilleja foliolosa TaxID=1961234 RepID=A0ABD3D8T9_9LAMI